MTSLVKPRRVLNESLRGLLQFEPHLGMVSCRVSNIELSLEFYVGVLGMQEILRVPGFGEDEHELVLEYPRGQGALLMLMWNTNRSVPVAHGNPYGRISIIVNDIHGAFSHVVSHGAPVQVPITKSNHVLWCVIEDPDGFMIELMQL